jgi:hypothetical protein
LIEVIVATALFSVVLMAAISIVVSQKNDIKGLYQKSDAVELKTLLVKTLENVSVCTPHLKDMVVDVASTTTTTASPTVLNLPKIFSDAGTSIVTASAGNALPLSRNGLVVDKISFKNILATGIPGEYEGNFEVSFTADSMVRPFRAVQLKKRIKVVSVTPGVTQIDSCLGSGQEGLVFGRKVASSCVQRLATSVVKSPCGIVSEAHCAPGEVSISGEATKGKNTSTQNSYGIFDSTTGVMTGWRVDWYGTNGNCTNHLDTISDGTVAPGDNPCFCDSGGTCFCGSSAAYCCI